MAYLQSSQSFVRALKAPIDPPSEGAPAKIDIAREVWNDAPFNAQNKAEAIVDFILTKLLKERAKTTDSPVTDQRFWDLLSAVLSNIPLSTSSATATKAWLLPLLNRVPLVPICTSLLEKANKTDPDSAVTLLDVSSQALSAIWPLASPKFTADILLDSFGALLSTATRLPNESQGLVKLGTLICTSLQDAYNNSANKKKLHQTFTQTHLQRWVECVACLTEEDTAPSLLTNLYHTGRDILFNVDTLKSLSEPSSLKTLFGSLPAFDASLSVLPKLLQSFAVASRRHRTLFGQGTSAPTAARAAAMLFFASCTDYIRNSPNTLSQAACAARLALLRVVETESLLGFGQTDDQQVIRREVALCISALPSIGTTFAESALLLDSLCVVSRIDHDLLEPLLRELLPRLLVIPPLPHPAAASASELLTLCTSYHSRARSLPTFVEQIQLVFESMAHAQAPARELYPRAAGSPLLSHGFLTALARAVQTFVTPGQVLSTAQGLVTVLTRVYENFAAVASQSAADRGNGPRKKARTSRASTGTSASSEAAIVDAVALSFAFLGRLAACVLPALPIQTVTSDVKEEIRECVRQADFVKHNLLSQEAHRGEDRREDSWAGNVVLAAALRLAYALQAAARLQFNIEHTSLFMELHQNSSVLPELFLELTRYLLKTVPAQELDERNTVFDQILSFLERHLVVTQAWNGRAAELAYGDDGASQAAIGLLRLGFDRSIHIFDVIASQAQIDRLVELLFRAAASHEASSNALTPGMVATECLRSANLWEQRRLRSSLLSSINSRLQGIDDVNVESITSAAPHSMSLSSTGLKSDAVDRALEGFYMLLYCPSEYMSKSSRADIVRRAVLFDVTLAAVNTAETKVAASRAVKTFLQRTFKALGSAEHQFTQPYLESLVRSVAAGSAEDQTTLDIIDIHMRMAFRTAQKGPGDGASALTAMLLPLPPAQSSPSVDQNMDTLRGMLMTGLVRDFSADSFPEDIKEALVTFQEHASARIEHLSSSFVTADWVLQNESVIAMLTAHLRFTSWLGINQSVDASPSKASELVKVMVASKIIAPDLAEQVYALLVAEFECKTQAKEHGISQMLASYVVLSQLHGTSSEANQSIATLDDVVSKAARRLAVDDFAWSLDHIAEGLQDVQDADRLSHVVRLGSVLLRGAPEGTLKVTQAFLTRALCAFVDYPIYIAHPSLRAQVLTFIDQQCCERPATLRLVNLSAVWPLLSRVLAGSPLRDKQTSSMPFHKVISIIGALVRLRRDLVVNTQPHLCIVLRMLVTSLRGPRPNLGGKQRQAVAESLPAWVDPDRPLGAEESKALARLMTTFATKTIVRVHATSTESQKAYSLARPLSKHVAYVIQAYVGAVNDPLCVVPLAVRQELMSGLFVLCGMLNEHDRDALMASGLDAAGKVTFKALWKDYEKQRYVGKG